MNIYDPVVPQDHINLYLCSPRVLFMYHDLLYIYTGAYGGPLYPMCDLIMIYSGKHESV